jgi:hypothetical protein
VETYTVCDVPDLIVQELSCSTGPFPDQERRAPMYTGGEVALNPQYVFRRGVILIISLVAHRCLLGWAGDGLGQQQSTSAAGQLTRERPSSPLARAIFTPNDIGSLDL